jgi:predicted RNA-binding Zn ribbon-like protein
VPAWAPGDESKPAPGRMLLVQAFVNTRGDGGDVLADAEAANDWLHMSGLLAPDVVAGPTELRVAREVREAIRALIGANGTNGAGGSDGHDSVNGDKSDAAVVSADDIRTLEAVAGASHVQLGISTAGQVDLASRPGGELADGMLSLLLVIRDAQREGTWDRLKLCGNPDCRWAFYDRSHSRRGAWCDMATCGNLIKNRNLRARRSAPAPVPGGS